MVDKCVADIDTWIDEIIARIVPFNEKVDHVYSKGLIRETWDSVYNAKKSYDLDQFLTRSHVIDTLFPKVADGQDAAATAWAEIFPEILNLLTVVEKWLKKAAPKGTTIAFEEPKNLTDSSTLYNLESGTQPEELIRSLRVFAQELRGFQRAPFLETVEPAARFLQAENSERVLSWGKWECDPFASFGYFWFCPTDDTGKAYTGEYWIAKDKTGKFTDVAFAGRTLRGRWKDDQQSYAGTFIFELQANNTISGEMRYDSVDVVKKIRSKICDAPVYKKQAYDADDLLGYWTIDPLGAVVQFERKNGHVTGSYTQKSLTGGDVVGDITRVEVNGSDVVLDWTNTRHQESGTTRLRFEDRTRLSGTTEIQGKSVPLSYIDVPSWAQLKKSFEKVLHNASYMGQLLTFDQHAWENTSKPMIRDMVKEMLEHFKAEHTVINILSGYGRKANIYSGIRWGQKGATAVGQSVAEAATPYLAAFGFDVGDAKLQAEMREAFAEGFNKNMFRRGWEQVEKYFVDAAEAIASSDFLLKVMAKILPPPYEKGPVDQRYAFGINLDIVLDLMDFFQLATRFGSKLGRLNFLFSAISMVESFGVTWVRHGDEVNAYPYVGVGFGHGRNTGVGLNLLKISPIPSGFASPPMTGLVEQDCALSVGLGDTGLQACMTAADAYDLGTACVDAIEKLAKKEGYKAFAALGEGLDGIGQLGIYWAVPDSVKAGGKEIKLLENPSGSGFSGVMGVLETFSSYSPAFLKMMLNYDRHGGGSNVVGVQSIWETAFKGIEDTREYWQAGLHHLSAFLLSLQQWLEKAMVESIQLFEKAKEYAENPDELKRVIEEAAKDFYDNFDSYAIELMRVLLKDVPKLLLPIGEPGRLTGQDLGAVGSIPLKLGNVIGTVSGYASEREVVVAAREEWRILDDPDTALIEDGGTFYIYLIEAGVVPGPDLGSYGQIRAGRFITNIGGGNLLAICSDDQHIRFFAPQKSPKAFARVPLPTSTDSVEQLIEKAELARARLIDMENTLGPGKDHRGLFSSMYRVITDKALAILRQLHADGKTVEALFEGRLISNFGNKFFQAYDDYAVDPAKVKEIWRATFDSGRVGQAIDYALLSCSEIIGMSMTAHIIHDLPFTLKEIGFDAQNQAMNACYDSFNSDLIAEKNNILNAARRHFGATNLHALEAIFTAVVNLFSDPTHCDLADDFAKHGFTALRDYAKYLFTQGCDPARIERDALLLSDTIRTATPGGN